MQIFSSRLRTLGGFICILVLSIYTYIPGYDKPAALFWDENFHIASAQRYLNGVFFLEPHPPLGKLLIASGEYLFGFNEKNDQFISVEKAENIPLGFSFAGYRFFPVLFGALLAPLIFLVIVQISKNPLLAFMIALAPAFDNALIVHNRGAMLESSQLFFILLSILSFLFIREQKREHFLVVLGICTASALLIKINSAPILLLPFALIFTSLRFSQLLVRYCIPFVLTYLFVWHIHFAIAKKIEPDLDSSGYFGVSSFFREALNNGSSHQLKYLFLSLKESFEYTARYQKGVPELDYSKEEENGSSPLLWPLGARTINYRWADINNKTQYLYLISNPAAWLVGLAGIVLSFIVLGLKFFSSNRKNADVTYIYLLLLMYLATWLAPFGMNRVFYLYHYFVPLTFSWILCGVSLSTLKISRLKSFSLIFVPLCIVGCYAFFSPLTYYTPISNVDLQKRAWLPIWDLRCQNCVSSFFTGLTKDQYRTDPSWKVSIGNLEASSIEQSEGTPLQENADIEVVTRSKIQFPLNKRFKTLKGQIGLSESITDREVEFKILLDGKTAWIKEINSASASDLHFELSVKEYTVLTLIVSSAKSAAVEWRELALL